MDDLNAWGKEMKEDHFIPRFKSSEVAYYLQMDSRLTYFLLSINDHMSI